MLIVRFKPRRDTVVERIFPPTADTQEGLCRASGRVIAREMIAAEPYKRTRVQSLLASRKVPESTQLEAIARRVGPATTG